MPDASAMVEKFNGTFLEDMMYPTMPQIPAAAMRGGSPSQQFGYPATQMQQGAGAAVPQNPVYGSQPVYMAKGGPVGAGPQQQIGQGSGKGQQAPGAMPQQMGQSGKGQAGPGQQAPMQMPGESMNAAMEDFRMQQDMQQGRMGPMGQGLAALRGYQDFMGQQGGPGMGPQQAPGQMPQQSPQDMRADYDRFRQGRGDRLADFRQRMQNQDIPPAEKRRMTEEFRRGTEQEKQISQDFRQRMYPSRGQQAPMGMPQQMPQAQQLDMMRRVQQAELARMQGMPTQQALQAQGMPTQQSLQSGIQALGNFRPMG